MKTLKLLTLLLLTLISSCLKEEIEVKKTFYDTQSFNITHEIDLHIVPTNDVSVDVLAMEEELNKDYYNRYGIKINLIQEPSVPSPQLTEGVTYLPKPKDKKIKAYIVLPELVVHEGVSRYGYATVKGYTIVISENHIESSVFAHEVGHVFGLLHRTGDLNNVMGGFATRSQKPLNFTEDQVKTIKNNIENRQL